MDCREPTETMHQAMQDCGEIELEIQQLPLGDYLVDNRLRKTYPDLVRSIIDGRLFQQAHRLAEAPHATLLLLEGSENDSRESNMQWEAIQGALVTVSLFFGMQFGSVEAVINASPEALCEVAGIGESTASRMRWAVEESLVPYDGRCGFACVIYDTNSRCNNQITREPRLCDAGTFAEEVMAPLTSAA